MKGRSQGTAALNIQRYSYADVIPWGDRLLDGKSTKDYAFMAPPAGTYFFRCDIHSDTMTGTLVAK